MAFAEWEIVNAMLFVDHHLSLDMPEERTEDKDKVMVTRYTPLGVVGGICTSHPIAAEYDNG